MSDKTNRLPHNVPGAYYVDSSCVDCDLCRNTAPDFFKRDEETGFSFVYRQPFTSEERALAEEAKQGCPTESIGNDGIEENAAPSRIQIQSS
jgi:ferredoxin